MILKILYNNNINKEIVRIQKIIRKDRKIGGFLVRVNRDIRISLGIMVEHLIKDLLQINKNRTKHPII